MCLIYLIDDQRDFLKSFTIRYRKKLDIKTFTSPTEALKNIHIDKPKIAISDIMMPDVHGIDFAAIASIIEPKIKLIFISGNSDKDINLCTSGLPENAVLFRKPLTEEFHRTISSMVETLRICDDKEGLFLKNDMEPILRRYKKLFENYTSWYNKIKEKYKCDTQKDWSQEDQNQNKIHICELNACKFILGLSEEQNRAILKKMVDVA